jgi:hypothetical protein
MKITKDDIVFITGPMTGIEKNNYPAFHRAAARLRGDYGCGTLNPANAPDGLSYRQYMSLSTQQVLCTTAIYMLPGWKDSPGARAEHALAEAIGLKVFYEEEVP